jgi:hypothetical protein
MLPPRIFVTHRALTNTQRAATLHSKDENISTLSDEKRRLQREADAAKADAQRAIAAAKAATEFDKV